MAYRLKVWNAPPDDVRYSPFISEFSDMPSDTFATIEEAHAAAAAFVEKYKAKGGGGGHNHEDDYYHARDEVAPDRFRFTQIIVAQC